MLIPFATVAESTETMCFCSVCNKNPFRKSSKHTQKNKVRNSIPKIENRKISRWKKSSMIMKVSNFLSQSFNSSLSIGIIFIISILNSRLTIKKKHFHLWGFLVFFFSLLSWNAQISNIRKMDSLSPKIIQIFYLWGFSLIPIPEVSFQLLNLHDVICRIKQKNLS